MSKGRQGYMTGVGVFRMTQDVVSMVEDAQVSRHDLVLQHGACRDVDAIPVVGDDDHRALP